MTEIHSAAPQLLALAAGMRPDWSDDDLRGALAAAAGNGWPFARACLAAVRLLCKPGSEARDLLAEVASPLATKSGPAGDPGAIPEVASVLAAAHARIAQRQAGGPQ